MQMIQQLEQKEYYNLNQILTNGLTRLRLRQLKKRLKEVASEITDSNLISKEGKFWKIHKSILNKFEKSCKVKKTYETEVSINFYDSKYTKEYYTEMANQFYTNEPSQKMCYSIETSNAGKVHVHIATTLTTKQASRVMDKLSNYFQLNMNIEPFTHISTIINLKDYLVYISKETIPIVLN